MLDLRLFCALRSAQDIALYMHRLLPLPAEGESQHAVAETTTTTTHEDGEEEKGKEAQKEEGAVEMDKDEDDGRRKKEHEKEIEKGKEKEKEKGKEKEKEKEGGSTSVSLLAWYPFEDGEPREGGPGRAVDVTEHRFASSVKSAYLQPQEWLDFSPPMLMADVGEGVGVGEGGADEWAEAAPVPAGEELARGLASGMLEAQQALQQQRRALGKRRFLLVSKRQADRYLPAPPPQASAWIDADAVPLPFAPPLAPGEEQPLPVPSFRDRGICQASRVGVACFVVLSFSLFLLVIFLFTVFFLSL